MPYLARLEEEFNRKLSREDEFGEYYFLFGLNGLLRGDAKTRSEYYKNMNIVGTLSANEARSQNMLPIFAAETGPPAT